MIISGRITPNPETEMFLGMILNDMHDDQMTVIQVAQKYQKLLLFEEKLDLIFEICKELEQSAQLRQIDKIFALNRLFSGQFGLMSTTVQKNIYEVREAMLYSPTTNYRKQDVIDTFEALKKEKDVELVRQYVKYLYNSENIEDLKLFFEEYTKQHKNFQD